MVDGPGAGSVVVDGASGEFVYTPESSGFVGLDGFTFRVGVQGVWSEPATMSVRLVADGHTRGVWELDEGAGVASGDASGWDHDGVVSGGVTWTEGVTGTALRFDGHDGQMRVDDRAGLDLSDGATVSAWVRPERVATQTVVKKARIEPQ